MWSHPASRRAAVYAWRENVSCRFEANTHRARHNTHTYTHTYTPSHTYKSRVGPDDLEQKLKVSRWLCVKSAGGGLLKCGKLTVLCSCFWKCWRALWFIENVLTSRVDESICFALENDVQEGLKKKKVSSSNDPDSLSLDIISSGRFLIELKLRAHWLCAGLLLPSRASSEKLLPPFFFLLHLLPSLWACGEVYII